MKKEVMEKWVAALRSGKYPQTKAALRTEKGFCCLGVLCDLSGLAEFTPRERGNLSTYLGAASILPPEVQAWAGMNGSDGWVRVVHEDNREGDWSLAGLNDAGHLDFNGIADLIEEQYERL